MKWNMELKRNSEWCTGIEVFPKLGRPFPGVTITKGFNVRAHHFVILSPLGLTLQWIFRVTVLAVLAFPALSPTDCNAENGIF